LKEQAVKEISEKDISPSDKAPASASDQLLFPQIDANPKAWPGPLDQFAEVENRSWAGKLDSGKFHEKIAAERFKDDPINTSAETRENMEGLLSRIDASPRAALGNVDAFDDAYAAQWAEQRDRTKAPQSVEISAGALTQEQQSKRLSDYMAEEKRRDPNEWRIFTAVDSEMYEMWRQEEGASSR
jgi:hypothetical protein